MSFISYSQNGEDVLLWRALGHIADGFYIDVGANDPVADSVTKAFYDAGWHGINIEPLPALHRALQTQRPRDINLALAAGASEGSIALFDVPDVNGWASPDPAVAAAHGHALAELNVPMRTLSAICAQYAPAAIHFLKVDVEGYEREVLRGMDFSLWRPWVLVIEATIPNSRVGNHAGWDALVTGHGYRHVWFDGLNRYYVADEHAELAAALALQPNVFDQVIPFQLDSALKACTALRAEIALATARAAEAGAHAADEAARAAREAARAEHAAALAVHEAAHAARQAARATREAARADQASARQRAAELRAADADQLSHQASARLATARARNHKLQRQLARLRNEAATRSQHLLAVQAWAAELERHLLATRHSTSWRVTAPLRLAGAVPRRAAGALQRLRAAVRQAVLRASASERLRRLLIPVLLRFPGQVARVTRLLARVRQPEAAPPASPAPDMPDELRAMPVKARRVLADLQRARGAQDQG